MQHSKRGQQQLQQQNNNKIGNPLSRGGGGGGGNGTLSTTTSSWMLRTVIMAMMLFGLIGLLASAYMAYSTLTWSHYSHYDEIPVLGQSAMANGGGSGIVVLVNDRHDRPLSSTKTTSTAITPGAVRQQFYNRYGGRDVAEAMLQRGMEVFGDSVMATSQRLLQAAAARRPFVMAFAGYSVTVGRGNHYHQSFPFLLRDILEPLLRSILDINITVRNSAIGGIPSFPYGFCLEHFLGSDPDVVSWDYSMNEGSGAAVLESYIRHSQSQLSRKKPMLILLDTNKNRRSLLRQYTTSIGAPVQVLLKDAISVGMAKDILSTEQLDMASNGNIPDSQKPLGFREWNEFGAAKNCPGRGSWHPKRQEHALIAWIMAMYFVQAVERAQKIMQERHRSWRAEFLAQAEAVESQAAAGNGTTFPPPFQLPPSDNDESVTALLFGHADKDNPDLLRMKHVSCRTSFLPATDHDRVLPSIVVSGLSPTVTAENIIEPRSDDAYMEGWVLDVSKTERDTKISVERCGGLGYVDMKIALYGIPESGPLRLWLPTEPNDPAIQQHHQDHHHDNVLDSRHWFDNLVICEANEKRDTGACQLDTDVEYIVGGVSVSPHTTKMIAGAAEYLKRRTCVHIGIPVGAIVTKLSDLRTTGNSAVLSRSAQQRLLGNTNHDYDDDSGSNHIGLVVDIRARTRVTRAQGACCLSHIVWEQH